MKGSLSERFWEKVKKTDGCWLWLACKNGRGYGQIGIGGRGSGKIYAHRASWLINNGPIPDFLCVLHRCDNPSCVRPDHLFLGTQLDNAQDRVRKGRDGIKKGTHHGERNATSILKETQVREIISRYKVGDIRQIDLAQQYGLTRSGICMILTNRSWKHIGREVVNCSK